LYRRNEPPVNPQAPANAQTGGCRCRSQSSLREVAERGPDPFWRLELAGPPLTDGGITTKVYEGEIEGVTVLGWSTNLQSSYGVTRALRTKLAERLATLTEEAGPHRRLHS
jgi:hypothetical protein